LPEGGIFTATTYIRPYKTAAGKSAIQTMEDRFTYGLNPEKLGAVSSYLCDPNTAPAEFLLVKSQYLAETGRAVSRGALFFQIRQAFLPGEVTAEEANRIGYETAMRWTKGKYQFFICTHTDKAHIHNHIYFNATAFDRSRKFHNFIGSSFALRRLSDRVCIEHELSVIQNPRQHSKGCFLHYGQWIGEKPPSAKQRVRLAILAALEKKPTDFSDFLRLMEESGFSVKQGRGGVISFLAPGQEKPTRLRASTLGAGFDPEDIKATGDYNNEYLFHLFNSAGEEVGLTDTDTATGKKISDYSPNDTSAHYTVSFIGETHSYTLLLAKNTDKESQVVEALHKALPALVIVIVIVSVLVAVFYAWYITAPIKKTLDIYAHAFDKNKRKAQEKLGKVIGL
jgi:hypothetical protein